MEPMVTMKRVAIVVMVLTVLILGRHPVHAAPGPGPGGVVLDYIDLGDDGVYRAVLIFQNLTYKVGAGAAVPDATSPSFLVASVSATSVTITDPSGGGVRTINTSY
jgi:hypothetical protein